MTSIRVHAAIWVGDKLVVHRHTVRGRERITLPGGRLRDRESVTDALLREVREEVDLDIEVGDLLLAAEVLNSGSLQNTVLVFEGVLPIGTPTDQLDLVDPFSAEADDALPPLLGELGRLRLGLPGAPASRWLGNLHGARRVSA